MLLAGCCWQQQAGITRRRITRVRCRVNMSTAGAVFADKAGFSAGAYIISLTLSLRCLDRVFIVWSIKQISQCALKLNWSVGATWRFTRDDPYYEISFDAARWCDESALEAFQSSLKDDEQKQMFYQLKLLMKNSLFLYVWNSIYSYKCIINDNQLRNYNQAKKLSNTKLTEHQRSAPSQIRNFDQISSDENCTWAEFRNTTDFLTWINLCWIVRNTQIQKKKKLSRVCYIRRRRKKLFGLKCFVSFFHSHKALSWRDLLHFNALDTIYNCCPCWLG